MNERFKKVSYYGKAVLGAPYLDGCRTYWSICRKPCNSGNGAQADGDADRGYGDEGKSSYIGKEAAKTKAFAHAGVTASQAKYVEVELHGSVYEVEFVVNTTEYEYKINAQTGSVTHYEKDEKGNTSSVSGTSLIGEEKAKATAFSHAGVTASQVKYLEVELHGNAYEVEFHVGNTEYEYAIDAVSGTILRSEKKAD